MCTKFESNHLPLLVIPGTLLTIACVTDCNFRSPLSGDDSGWRDLGEVDNQLRQLAEGGQVSEILVLAGEVHPGSKLRSAWFEHCAAICRIALSHSLLPHANIGPLSAEEMKALAELNVSMGLMLEQSTTRLLETGMVHAAAPSKRPELRRAQLVQAGELGVPFTTGLLLGIGETEADRLETLNDIAELAVEFGHIGECIVQPYSVGESEASLQKQTAAPLGYDLEQLPAFVATARATLPTDVAIQVPPVCFSQFSLSFCTSPCYRDRC